MRGLSMFEGEAKYYWDWTSTSKLSYGDFLRARQFERSLRFAVDDQTSRLVASNEQLLEHGFSKISDDLTSGFSMLSADINAVEQAVERGTEEIVAALAWGFGGVMNRLNRVNQSLDELLRLAKNPSQTWAYEQFEIARDEYRRGLYPEALESVARAIGGHGANPGFKTEFRFHYLQGEIRLGKWLGGSPNVSPEVVDPVAAEAAFLSAARYSQTDFPDEAGKALVMAGRAAYVQREFARASQTTAKGVALRPNDAKAVFQLAKCYCAEGGKSLAEIVLLRAILLRPDIAILASAEPEFLAHREMLDRVIRGATSQFADRYQKTLHRAGIALAKARAYEQDGKKLASFAWEQLRECDKILATAAACRAKDNLLGAYDASVAIVQIQPAIEQLPAKYAQALVDTAKARGNQYKPPSEKSVTITAVVLSVAIWIYAFIRWRHATFSTPNSWLIETILRGLYYLIGYGAVAAFVNWLVVMATVFIPMGLASLLNGRKRGLESQAKDQAQSTPNFWQASENS